jgi:predicted ATPase/class 3 adenylate cyclase/tetratricopeptide (TPR) repeat protein
MAELPTGTVTFLFTDIEGSTRLWGEHPEAMKEALALHDELLLTAIEDSGGYVFSASGDAFSAAFARGHQAVSAALVAQRAFRSQDWGGAALRVRMALHTGEADERRGDYFGPALNEAARLLAAGHGGQVLVSAATKEVLGSGLPDNSRLRDLGEHRLKDLTRAVRVFQLTHPDLIGEFPALRTLEAFPNNLPAQLSSFVGRKQELAEIEKLLQGARLVTLTGAGGCGKTRMALQAAASVLSEFPDGVWFVDLAPVADPELVVATTARSMGLGEPGDRRALDVLLAFVEARKTLIVLDNCEHLLGPASRLTADMLQAAPQVRVLATTREPLRLQGEVVWPVPPLQVPADDTASGDLLRFESVRLFQERAESARPGFRVTDANGEAIRQICRRLDGIPLALELVTARLRVLSTKEIAARLDDSLSVLGTAGEDVAPHHRTLGATLDWSFGLLSKEEQRLLSQLSVFMGGFTMEATEQVCSGEGVEIREVLGLITGLADKSLVVVGEGSSGTRYRLLETLRQYALRKLAEAGEEAAFRKRHAEYFAQLAEESFPQLIGPDEVQWLDRLEDEVDNLRSALAWHLEADEIEQGQLMAGALYRFWGRSLRNLEARNWLERMLNASPTLGMPRARVLLGLSTVSGFSVVERSSFLDEALELYGSFGPQYELETARNNRAVWALTQGDWRLAASLYQEGLDRARQRGDEGLIGRLAGNLSALKAEWEGDLEAAALLAGEAVAAARKFGSPEGIHSALCTSADVAMHRQEFPLAVSALEEALEIEREPGARIWYVGDALLGLADVAYRAGRLDQAIDYLSQHHDQIEMLGYDDPHARSLAGLFSLFLRAKIELARDNHLRGVVLMAAVDSVDKDVVLPPSDTKQIDEALSRARQALGEESFTTAWNEGAALTLSQALDYALSSHGT